MAKATIIFVPGAWHVPAHFDYVRKELESAGYTCIGVDLPGHTASPWVNGRLLGIEDDVAAVRQTVLSELDNGNNVLLVTHSYGAVPGTASLAGLSTQARKAEGKTTSVLGVVIISGLLLPPGTTMLAMMGGQLPPQYLYENDVTLPFNGPGAIEILYNDLDHLEQQKAIWKLKPQSYGINASTTPDQIAAVEGLTISCLLCKNDNAVPWAFQTGGIQSLRAHNREVYAEVAISGHSPFLKYPIQTAKFVRKAAGEELETGFERFED